MQSPTAPVQYSRLPPIAVPPASCVLDIGGEGQHAAAWNLNPRMRRTVRGAAGQCIPRLIVGRGEAIPLRDRSVDVLIVERTPLSPATLREILRVAKPGATVILRHAMTPLGDPHRQAREILAGTATHRVHQLGAVQVRETVVHFPRS
jgi:ubiquinone/menaquinone biosynthesis C-methylase UbiE